MIAAEYCNHLYGGIAQLARAFGSYPKCRWFKSVCRYHIWPVGQAVKTPPFHGGIASSILARVTKTDSQSESVFISGPLVKRLRHRPFTAVSRVRFSHGSPKTDSSFGIRFFAFTKKFSRHFDKMSVSFYNLKKTLKIANIFLKLF